jgi:hypothetical protein
VIPSAVQTFWDIRVWDKSNENTNNYTFLGTFYANDTGLNEEKFFSRSQYFPVSEIEMFEITDIVQSDGAISAV